MVLGQGSIPGHSGTGFKHRKAFSKIKEVYNKDARTNGAIEVNREELNERLKQNLRGSYIIATVGSVSVIGFFFVIAYLLNFTLDEINRHERAVTLIVQQRETNPDNRYFTLMKTGIELLEKNALYFAQEEFTHALTLRPYDYRANLYMTETLLKRCVQEHILCKEAIDYLERMKQVEGAPKKHLERLGNIIP